jgi:hypothetical protein
MNLLLKLRIVSFNRRLVAERVPRCARYLYSQKPIASMGHPRRDNDQFFFGWTLRLRRQRDCR